MKLFHSPASPFVRKVMVFAHETRLTERLTLIESVVSPVNRDPGIVPHNPSGHIPTLLLDEGTALFDSRVILQYLDTLHQGSPLHPGEPLTAARVLCMQSLADAAMDAGVLLRYESALRPEALRWADWEQGQWSKIAASLDSLSSKGLPLLELPLHVGAIAVGCMLSYLDFRFSSLDWRAQHPELACWYAEFAQRPSMQATKLRPQMTRDTGQAGENQ